MFGRRAVDIYREVAFCKADNIPPYQGEQVRLVLEEINQCTSRIEHLLKGIQERNREILEASGNTQAEPSWMNDYPEESTAIQIYHAAVLRNKRLLLAYHSARMGLVRTLRWRHRNLPDILKQNLSTAEQAIFKEYSRELGRYMGIAEGVGIDLTLDELPPTDVDIVVKVLEDFGVIQLSNGMFNLMAGTSHLLPRQDAERLIREGVVERMES